MSVKDIIKNSVYESFVGNSGQSFTDICLVLVMACVIGVYIFGVYKFFTKSAFYSKDLNISIAGMTVVVAAIVIAMQANLLVSLGMVGALSIVRFRTAVKNPLDLFYLFWGISAGIICGVKLYVLVIVLCVIMTLLVYVLGIIPVNKAPAILVLKTKSSADISLIFEIIKANSNYLKENSYIIKNGEKEIIYEINTKDPGLIMDKIGAYEGVISVTWLTHTGEMRA